MIQVAVGIIIRKEISTSVLLCRRKESARYGLKWEFPGGKVEKDETTEECLLRELTEELSITAVIGSLYHQQQYLYPDSGTFDVFYYMIRQFSGSIVNRVFESFEWVSTAKLLEYDILEGNRDVVKKLMHEFR
ncbi:MAG TPA: 8-oxo-dGTP diphosphatase MutT [Bacteroidota bacterium]|nr:8-oxo-dGTP diphosphatase MutT [Bacteroidota bacterium]